MFAIGQLRAVGTHGCKSWQIGPLENNSRYFSFADQEHDAEAWSKSGLKTKLNPLKPPGPPDNAEWQNKDEGVSGICSGGRVAKYRRKSDRVALFPRLID